jgi:hypothetical protein
MLNGSAFWGNSVLGTDLLEELQALPARLRLTAGG